nr:MAG TPA: hypothetical protein [Caudoviricetes sp.]
MTNITTMQPGEHFMFKNFEWVCLDPNHPDGGVLAIMATPWKEDMRFCPDMRYTDGKGNWNNYFSSSIRTDLIDVLADTLGNNLLLHEVELVADNGDFAYGKVEDPIFLLTCDEYRKYRDYIPHYDSWIWTATPWFCGYKDSDTGCGAAMVRTVDIGDRFGCVGACLRGAVAPACVLNPKLLNLRQSMAYVEEVSE